MPLACAAGCLGQAACRAGFEVGRGQRFGCAGRGDEGKPPGGLVCVVVCLSAVGAAGQDMRYSRHPGRWAAAARV